MVLENLAFLDASMRAADCRAARFTVRGGGTSFSVVYVNDSYPQELLVLRGEPRRWARVLVQKGHQVDLLAFRPLLEPTAPADAPVSVELKRALADFDLAIPRTISGAERATPETILQHSPDVDEPGKIYFFGWSQLGEPEVRPQNPKLQKTRRAFGQDVYELCLHLHMSSQWTEDATSRVAFKLPE